MAIHPARLSVGHESHPKIMQPWPNRFLGAWIPCPKIGARAQFGCSFRCQRLEPSTPKVNKHWPRASLNTVAPAPTPTPTPHAGSRPSPWSRITSRLRRRTSTTCSWPGACYAMASPLSLRTRPGGRGGKKPPWLKSSTWSTT